MREKSIADVIIPARAGKAFEVRKGQIMRITEVEGKQVADVNAWNLHDYREIMDVMASVSMARNYKRVDEIYTNRYNVMFTVLSDTIGVHYFGSHCSRAMYSKYHGMEDHPNCFDILADSVKSYGLTHDDVHNCFNVFMNCHMQPDGTRIVKPPVSDKGDYVDWQAEMDCLVAVAACPGDIAATNDFIPKSLGIRIFET